MVTVSPSGQRLETVQPLPVGFGLDGNARRVIRFGNGSRVGTACVVNGVPVSVSLTVRENGRTWEREAQSGYMYRQDTGGYVRASDSAHRKLWDWCLTEAPKLAEEHADEFTRSERDGSAEQATAWLDHANRYEDHARMCRDYADLEQAVADGAAKVVANHRSLADWPRITRQKPPEPHGRSNQDGVLEPSAAVIANDGTLIGLAVGVGSYWNKRLVLVPLHLAKLK